MYEEHSEKSLLTQEKLSLKSWGLPRAIMEKYASKGIENMFPWQVECLTSDGVLSGRNLVYSAPTSAGKTMVAEILTIQTVLERKKKVIIILPFISVVREKMLYFQNLLGSSGVRVEGFMGSHAPPGGLKTVHIAVCTIEKANSLINRLLEDQGLDAVGCVVVDEVHLLGDPHRGYLLELLLTKLKYMCLKEKMLKIQIVGMSATLPNIVDLAKWLEAALYVTHFRPIPLTEHLKINSSVFDASTLELKYNVQPIVKFKSDPGDVIHLCLESLLSGHSVLVFCSTRSWCETCAQQISAEFRKIGFEKDEVGLRVREQLDGSALSDVLEQLKRCPAGLDQSLGRSIAFGVAFHHAGLTMDERDIVEGAFRTSVLRVLVATSTLSSGVNLPARRVLIRCPPRNMSADILTYRQMVGRAGRMGKDTAGESFLICNGSERTLGEQLVRSQLPPVESSLSMRDLSSSLKRAVLEVIASGVVNTSEDVETYTSCTFLASSSTESSQLGDPLAACVEYLQTNEFIRVTGHVLGPTALAEACLSASLPPDQGLKLLKELHRARQCFVLETELHVIYQVTPYSVADQWGQLDWLRVLSLWEDLPISMKRVGELVGVEERFLVRAVRGTVNTQAQDQKVSVHRRFYTALALQDLVNEVPLAQVALKFDCSKGVLQSLQQSASTFAGMVTQFSRRLGWSNVELLVSQFCARLQFGAQRELLDLLRLDCLTAVQARALYNMGIQALADLATASLSKVEKALSRATPFQSDNEESESSDKCRIWLVGRCAATEIQAADILIREARLYLERELGLQSANWGDLNATHERSASESQVTQSPDTPSQPIGQEVAGVGSKNEERSVTNKVQLVNEQKRHKIESVACDIEPVSIQSTKKDSEVKNEKMQINKSSLEQNTPKNCVALDEVKDNCTINKEENTQNEKTTLSDVNNDRESLDKIIEEGTVIENNSSEISQLLVNTANVKKRGSLDLFDSPEHLDDKLNHHKPGINIEEHNLEINSDSLQILQTSNASLIPNTSELNKNTPIVTKSNTNQMNEENVNSNLGYKAKMSASSLIGAFNNAHPQLNNNKHCSSHDNQSGDKSVFFDSPLPVELVEVRNNSFLNDFDVNFGGESLLEMSSWVINGEEKNKSDEEEINLLDANVGGGSLIDISFFGGTEERKRKRINEKESVNKRLKVNKSWCGPSNELQVSKITSTNANCEKSVKTSTPILSQYSYINFDSPFFANENVMSSEAAKVDGEDFLNVDSNDVHTTNIDPENDFANVSVVEGSPSFGLELSNELSENGFLCDNELNINKKICDTLDFKDDCFTDYRHNKDSPTHKDTVNISKNSLTFDDSVNIDSKLNALLDMKTSTGILGKLECSEKKEKPSSELNDCRSILCVKNCSFSGSFDIGSKLNALVDEKSDFALKVDEDKTEKTSPEPNYFIISHLNLNTQLCDLLDQENCEKISNQQSNSTSKQFGNSEIHIDTQLCNVLDNNDLGSNKKDVHNKKPEWTESMEVKEIQNLSFDEDTVFGTPLTHHKSVSFNKFGTKKTKLKTQLLSGKVGSGQFESLSNKKYAQKTCSPLKTTDQLDVKTIEKVDQNLIENKTSTLDTNEQNIKNTISNNGDLINNITEGKGNKIPTNSFTEVILAKLSKAVTKESTPSCTSLSNSFLEAAFELSFNQQTQEPEDDEVASSQQPAPVTPHKIFKERLQNINSPTVNMNRPQVQVVNINVSESGANRDFQSSVLAQKSVSLALTVTTTEDSNDGGMIGARIVKKKSEGNYPCCHHGTVVAAAVVCWGAKSGESKVYILPLDHKNYKNNLELLKEMLSRKELTVCVWEGKNTVKLLQQCCHLQCEARLSDPTVAEWLLKPHTNTPTLKQLARMYGLSAPQCSVETGFQALLVWELSRLLKARLKQAGLYTAFSDIEMPIQGLLAVLEIVGVHWDREYVDLLWTSVEEKMADLQNGMFSLSGKKFNLRSRTDLAKVKRTIKEISEDALVEFNQTLRNWRVLNSLKIRNMSCLLMQEGDRVRGSWEWHTVTGRISMQEPNLQHIPRDINIDDQVFSLRSAFVAGQGNILVSADFCQLELRLLAHFSHDPSLHLTFSQPGDVFTAIAAEWNNIPQDQVTDAVRQHTKQLCYGLIYGMGLRTLAEEMDVSEESASEMVESFHRTYPGVQSYVGRCVEQCRVRGYVSTIMGRRRFLPDITSHNKALRAQAERQAVNTTIQGSAADIAKVAMLRVDRTVHCNGLQAHPIIHLHDELIYEVAEKDVQKFVQIFTREMEGAVTLSIPLPVKVKKGASWGQLELID